MERPIQKSKRLSRRFTRGKRYAHQRQHREKVRDTPGGLVEHIKRQYRRKGEHKREHRLQNKRWSSRYENVSDV